LELQSQLLSNELTAVLRQCVRGYCYMHLETLGLVNVFIVIELDNR